ncbi:MAG TPA: diguanylate cyclase [Candidatus Acidoferrales bacterium]|nr:diguanylate cyclase [Candidatus Acidoferrales bacterium]
MTAALRLIEHVVALVATPADERFWESFAALLYGAFELRGIEIAVRALDEPDVRYSLGEAPHAGDADCVIVDLRLGLQTVGSISVRPRAPLDRQARVLLETCALLAGHAGDTGLAFVDTLTGIANRRKFDETLALEWTRCARDGANVTLLLVDLDLFAPFNDARGRREGDLCLTAVASALNGCILRPSDVLARYGGQEFVAILPGTDLGGGIFIAERFREAIAAAGIPHPASTLGRVSISVGAATAMPRSGGTPDTLIRSADSALSRAKLAGRNRAAAEGYASDAPPARPALAQP